MTYIIGSTHHVMPHYAQILTLVGGLCVYSRVLFSGGGGRGEASPPNTLSSPSK